MNLKPDFYLTTAGEYGPLSNPRACWIRDRISDGRRDDYVVVDFEPPLPRTGAADLRRLILSTRHVGASLFSPHKWPVSVYVTVAKSDLLDEEAQLKTGEVDLLAWGLLFENHEDAAAEWASFRDLK